MIGVPGTIAVREYYRDTSVQYRVVWSGEHLHYGYWDETAATHARSLVRMVEVMADAAGVGPGSHILDAGCGVGGSSVWLAKSRGAVVEGVTVTPEQIPAAVSRDEQAGVAPFVRFSVQDYQATGFPDRTFDVVWALESACYADGDDKARFLAEAFRVLKPGGRLVMADGFRPRDLAPRQERIHRAFCDAWAIGELGVWPKVQASATRIGFGIEEARDITEHVMPSARRLFLLHLLFTPLAWTLPEAMHKNWLGAGVQYDMFRSGAGMYGLMVLSKPTV